MSVIAGKTTECAACGGPIVQPVGQTKEFCSVLCYRTGRSFCKQCDSPFLSQPAFGHKRDFCSEKCQREYYRIHTSIGPSPSEELRRSTCKTCTEPIIQPRKGRRQFCSTACQSRWRTIKLHGWDITQEWGTFAPETRRSLQEVQQFIGMGAAKRLATAIDREYRPKLQGKLPLSLQGQFTTHYCKTCGKEFRRKVSGLMSREYCSSKCQPKRGYSSGEKSPTAKLTWKDVDEIRRLYAEGMSRTALSRKYGVGSATLYHIVNYKTWKPENDPRGGGQINALNNYRNGERNISVGWEQVVEIRTLYASGQFTPREIAKKYGVGRRAIEGIIRNKTWKSENDPSGKEHPKIFSRESNGSNGHVKLTWETVDEIRDFYATNTISKIKLAKKYGIGRKAINRIIAFEIYKPEHDPRRKSEVST